MNRAFLEANEVALIARPHPNPESDSVRHEDRRPRCALIGKHPIVRIVTDEDIHGLGEVEFTKPYLKPFVLHFRDALIGEDPTDVERCMLKIRQRGSFKPYGAAVSAIEHALWDIAGKAAGVPAYKLLGGKVRDRCAATTATSRRKRTGDRPEDYAADVKWMMEQPEGFFMVKQGIGVPLHHEGHIPRFPLRPDPDQGRLSRRDGSGADFASAAWPTCSTASPR